MVFFGWASLLCQNPAPGLMHAANHTYARSRAALAPDIARVLSVGDGRCQNFSEGLPAPKISGVEGWSSYMPLYPLSALETK